VLLFYCVMLYSEVIDYIFTTVYGIKEQVSASKTKHHSKFTNVALKKPQRANIYFQVYMSRHVVLVPRISRLVKAWISVLRIAGSSLTAGGVLFWHGPLASLSLHIASVGSDHHAKKMEVPTHGIWSKSLHSCKRSTSPFSLRPDFGG